MSYVVTAPEQVQAAARQLAGIRSLLAESAAGAAGPTTAIVPAAADQVSAAISAMFGTFGEEFQSLSAQAQAFHAEFVAAMNAGAGAYLGAEAANAEALLGSALAAPGAGAAAAQSVSAAGLLDGLTGVTGVGGLGPLGGVVNSLLPGLVNFQTGAGTFFTGIAGPYQALVYNTWNNLNSLTGGWLADPFPFVRQVAANQIGYGQIIATALQTGNFQPVTAIPGTIAHNLANVVGTLTNTGVTSSLVVQELTPTPDLTLDNAVGLPLLFGAGLIGPPAAALEAAGSSAAAFASAVQAGNASGAFAALIDAPAVIADGFLNGQATFPYALNLSSLTGPAAGSIANVTVVGNFPLDGLLHPPGYYPVTATVTLLDNTVLPPIDVSLGAGSTPFSGLLPLLVNYAPQQLAQAIGAAASPPPLILLPLFTF
ncbi:hypothetical protein A5660_07120 [Mycobacterium alsense]|uniref:PE family protein n=1 Tax=Mycobacterium alsense TaxID=324058 RepID=UPI0007FE2426|nr:PE family protein [Mycobacterium alsense]OBI97139.1 hypothetical protein A5660_07120 [Mycobacterium alsense]